MQTETYKKFINMGQFQSTSENLWGVHPPFQIDANFGATAGVAEMLIQSHEGFIEPLATLPEAWAKGSFKGLKARGIRVMPLTSRSYRTKESSAE